MSRALVIRADRLIDGVSVDPITDAAVVAEDGRITAVGPATSLSVPPDARRVDLGDRTLLPGLLDVHVHLIGWRSYAEPPPHELGVLQAAQDCGRLLDAGFTTVRDLGSNVALTLRNAVAKRVIPGPRIFAAGPLISQTGGHGDQVDAPFEEVDARYHGLLADGPDACRRAVRVALRRGADVIKICTTGGIGSAIGGPDIPQFTEDEIRAMVDEAHRSAVRITAHAQGKAGVLAAVRAGVDCIEHGYYVDEECVEAMLAHDTPLVPTHALCEVFKKALADPHDMPEHRLHKQRAVIPAMEASMRLAYTSGVRLGAGADYLGTPLREHGDNADELLAMIARGVTPMDAIRIATMGGAAVIGVEDKIGSLEPGKVADMIAVDGDPLTKPQMLRRVAFVAQGGRVHRSIND